jgi:transmembrane sensor
MIGQPFDKPDAIRDEAIAWRLRRERGPLSAAEAEAFSDWLSAAPEHPEAYAAIDAFWQAAGELERHPLFEQTRDWAAAQAEGAPSRRRALAAALAALAIGVGTFSAYLQLAPKPLADQSFRTAVGQRATVTLPDGSQVTLNTDTVLRTKSDDGRRLVYLDRGQAFFKVAHDRSHPFIVTAAGRTVTALGTAFDVRVDRGGLKVVLVEGKVRVETVDAAPAASRPGAPAAASSAAKPTATDMLPGSELVATTQTDWRLVPADVERETSWLQGQLVFDDAPLSAIAEEMNRYSTRKIEVDPRLANRRLSGNFSPGDVHGFSLALHAAGLADLKDAPDGSIEIVPLKKPGAADMGVG